MLLLTTNTCDLSVWPSVTLDGSVILAACMSETKPRRMRMRHQANGRRRLKHFRVTPRCMSGSITWTGGWHCGRCIIHEPAAACRRPKCSGRDDMVGTLHCTPFGTNHPRACSRKQQHYRSPSSFLELYRSKF